MATITLTHPRRLSGNEARRIVGAVTGNAYFVNSVGNATVDVLDSPPLQANGWIPAFGGSGLPTSGVATIDFGAFPGNVTAQVTVAAVDASDPNTEIDAWIIPVATADHTADEHIADPPRVIAAISGGNIVISGFASGRDLPVPPRTPFGNAAGSQMPIAQQQLTPSGKWSVALAFSP